MGPSRAIRYAYLLAMAGAAGNHVAGLMQAKPRRDAQRQTFAGGSALWKPSLRIDPNWAETMRRRSRKTAKDAVSDMQATLAPSERIAMRQGYRWRLGWKLLTLTMPHPAGLDTVGQLALLNGAFRRLGKRAEWLKAVYGGVKGVEDKLTAKGPHVHAHLLLLSRYLDREWIRGAWREALDAEAEKMGLDPLEYMSDGLPSVDVRRVVSKIKPGSDVRDPQATWEDALNEVSKYITKATDLLGETDGERIDPSVLLGLCDVKRWPRMFELLGRARKPRRAAKRASLDTSCISAVPDPSRNHVRVTVEDLNGQDNHIYTLEPCMVYEVNAPKRDRPPSWRDLISILSLESWCREVTKRAERGRAYRLRWIRSNMDDVFLVDMAGNVVVSRSPEESE